MDSRSAQLVPIEGLHEEKIGEGWNILYEYKADHEHNAIPIPLTQEIPEQRNGFCGWVEFFNKLLCGYCFRFGVFILQGLLQTL